MIENGGGLHGSLGVTRFGTAWRTCGSGTSNWRGAGAVTSVSIVDAVTSVSVVGAVTSVSVVGRSKGLRGKTREGAHGTCWM
jgi:hypothetical protein